MIDLIKSLPHFLLRVVDTRGELPLHAAYLLASHHSGNVIQDHGQVAQPEDDPQHYEGLVETNILTFKVTCEMKKGENLKLFRIYQVNSIYLLFQVHIYLDKIIIRKTECHIL